MTTVPEVRTNFRGLHTATGAQQAPIGGLLDATNTVLRRPNVLESRPGFAIGTLPAVESTGVLGAVPYPIEDNTSSVIHDGVLTRWDGGGHTSVIEDEATDPLTWETYQGVVCRRSLFLCTGDVLRALHEPGAATAYRTGAPVPALTAISSTAVGQSGPAYVDADHNARAYRALIRRGTPNGAEHVVRSGVSNRLIGNFSTPNNATITAVLHASDDFRAGDVIELYSTEAGDTYPTDEMYFNQEVELTSTHISQGYVEILDDAPNEDLGDALYTNDSREGFEGNHVRPPKAACVAEFNNSLWLGNLKYPARLDLTFKALFPSFIGFATTSQIGPRSVTGTRTNGSSTVSAVSGADIAKVKVGMLMYHADWSGTGWVRVTSVAADSFVADQTWNGATAAAALSLFDSIRVGSDYYPATYFVDYLRGRAATSVPATNASTLYTADWTTDVESMITAPDQRVMGLSISCIMPDTAPPQVWATNGHLYTPVLPEPSEATGLTMPQDVLPDHVAWSNQDEPEHFRLDNVERVGRSGSTVMGMSPSRSAILLFTDLGTWRGWGYADSGVSFDEMNKDVRILGRRCHAEVGEFVYVWADKGVFECDENQCTDLTGDVLSDLDEITKDIAVARQSCAKVLGNPKADEVLVCVPEDETTAEPIVHMFVFNQGTRAWTKWDLRFDLWDLIFVGRAQQLKGYTHNVDSTQLERMDGADTDYHDGDVSITVDAVSGTVVTLAASSYSPVRGDVIRKSSVDYVITAVASSTSVTVHRTGLTTGAATAYVAIESTITTVVNTLKSPQATKLWGEGALWWHARAGLHEIALGFRSVFGAFSSAYRVVATTLSSDTNPRSAGVSTKFVVDRAFARGTHLTTTLTVRQALSRWGLEGVSVKARVTGDRPPARLG